jgi:CelD/BcsL family acetyltransferase involved in cellulose biosynthesis
MQFTYSVLDDSGALDSMESTWRQLWSLSRPLSPMTEYRWIRTWWAVHRHEGKLLVIVVRNERDEPVALAPLYVRRDSSDPLRMLRSVHFLGTGEREADEVTGEYLGWLGPPDLVDAVSAIVGKVLLDRAHTWDRIRLLNVGQEQDLVRLRDVLSPIVGETTVTARPTFRIGVRPVDEYVNGLDSANFRHRCRRALRAATAARVEFVTARGPDETKELFAVLARLHQRRWRQRGKPGALGSAIFWSFHERLLHSYVADGTAWLTGLRSGDRWLGARYHLRAGDQVFDYLSGIDTDAAPALGPGLLLTLLGLKWCADNGVRSYDLFGGDYDYKRKLATETGQMVDLDIFRASLTTRLWLAARKLRSRLRAGRASAPTATDSA